MPRIIFHIPYKILRDHASGTQIRPLRLVEAFENLNYNVDFVEGDAKERKEKINEIRSNLKKGIVYDFMYSESSTEPTILPPSLQGMVTCASSPTW